MEVKEKVQVTKCLGVDIDYRLDWKRHIDHIRRNLHYFIEVYMCYILELVTKYLKLSQLFTELVRKK